MDLRVECLHVDQAGERVSRVHRKEIEEGNITQQLVVNKTVTVHHNDAQGGMLKYEFIDTIYGNCMKIEVAEVELNHITCGSVEDYMGYEQHRLNVVSQVTMEDMKFENKYYGNVILTDRTPLVVCPELERWKRTIYK